MLKLFFQGCFQCRLATDPDPTDEKRGISGPTFAAPGEADLDRVIRLSGAVNLRLPLTSGSVNTRYRVLMCSSSKTTRGRKQVLVEHQPRPQPPSLAPALRLCAARVLLVSV